MVRDCPLYPSLPPSPTPSIHGSIPLSIPPSLSPSFHHLCLHSTLPPFLPPFLLPSLTPSIPPSLTSPSLPHSLYRSLPPPSLTSPSLPPSLTFSFQSHLLLGLTDFILQILQNEQEAEIARLENQVLEMRAKHSEAIQKLKSHFLRDKRNYQQESDSRIQEMAQQASQVSAFQLPIVNQV